MGTLRLGMGWLLRLYPERGLGRSSQGHHRRNPDHRSYRSGERAIAVARRRHEDRAPQVEAEPRDKEGQSSGRRDLRKPSTKTTIAARPLTASCDRLTRCREAGKGTALPARMDWTTCGFDECAD